MPASARPPDPHRVGAEKLIRNQLQVQLQLGTFRNMHWDTSLFVPSKNVGAFVTDAFNIAPSKKLVVTWSNTPQGEAAVLVGKGSPDELFRFRVLRVWNQHDCGRHRRVIMIEHGALYLARARTNRELQGARRL